MIQACTITVYGKAFFSMIFRKKQPKNEIFWVLICEQESILTKDGFKQECQSNSGEKKVLYLIFSKKPYVLSINHGFLNELWTLNGTSLYRDFFENLKYNTIVQSILKIVLYCVVPIRALMQLFREKSCGCTLFDRVYTCWHVPLLTLPYQFHSCAHSCEPDLSVYSDKPRKHFSSKLVLAIWPRLFEKLAPNFVFALTLSSHFMKKQVY